MLIGWKPSLYAVLLLLVGATATGADLSRASAERPSRGLWGIQVGMLDSDLARVAHLEKLSCTLTSTPATLPSVRVDEICHYRLPTGQALGGVVITDIAVMFNEHQVQLALVAVPIAGTSDGFIEQLIAEVGQGQPAPRRLPGEVLFMQEPAATLAAADRRAFLETAPAMVVTLAPDQAHVTVTYGYFPLVLAFDEMSHR